MKLPPWPSAATAACTPAEMLLARRFGKLCRLLASLAAFSDCLPSRSLQAMALQRIIPQASLNMDQGCQPHLQQQSGEGPLMSAASIASGRR